MIRVTQTHLPIPWDVGNKLISNFMPPGMVRKMQADSHVRMKDGRITGPNIVRNSIQWCCPDDK